MECINGDGRPIENKELGLCASCAHAIRRADRMQVKEATPINKVSEKLSKNLNKYASVRAKFLLNRWCGVHGKPCLPVEIHHVAGRVGCYDEKEIPLLIDTRFFLAVCREAHQQIENNPQWAKDQGYSESRLTVKNK